MPGISGVSSDLWYNVPSDEEEEKMNQTSTLARYQIEREQQLERVLALLRQDERIYEVWVFGSLGRRDADALSDIDLIVVVRDDQLPGVIAERYTFAQKAGHPLFFLEAPQNAPCGGAYLMICYDAPTAPHIVDAYWQSETLAWDSSQAWCLFARSSSAQANDHTGSLPHNIISEGEGSGEVLPHQVRFFWMMFLIAAKYVYRNPHALEMHLFPHLSYACEDAGRILGKAALPDANNSPASVGEPAQKLFFLRGLADTMISWMASLPIQAGNELLPAIFRYLAMVEDALQ
jgi:hypothetical protein